MKNIKNTLLYLGILGVFFALMYWIIQTGKLLEAGRNIIEPQLQSS